MQEELRVESSAGIALENISLAQKILATVVSLVITGLIVAVPLVV